MAGTKRHPAQMNYRLGCDREGQLQALDCELLFDTGAYAAMGAEVFALAMEHAAALREAEEETGLDPDGVDVLGTLPDVPLEFSGHLVTPVLGWWRQWRGRDA